MTQEMYGATGKVGNKVYYRANGKTVVREAVTPKNPKTDLQTLQRVIVAQVGKSYQRFQQICNHSYEGYSIGAKCAARFRKLNLDYLRSRASEIQQSGNSLAQFYNFQPIGSTKWVPGAVILSQGQLPAVEVTIGQNTGGNYVGSVNIEANTYGDVVRALGLKRGDQLTFVGVSKFNGDYNVHYARIILDPRNADGSGAPMTSPFIVDGDVNLPNWKNTGTFELISVVSNSELQFKIGRGTQVGVAIIASRQNKDGEWLRNNASLVLSEDAIGSDLYSLWDAMENSYSSGSLDVESEYYLNNAGVGGSQGSSQQGGSGGDDNTPSYNNTVQLNGVSQNISGGSASVTAPINTVTITGTNLADSDMYAVKSDSAEHISPTTKTATTISFTALDVAAGQNVKFYKDGALWFTANAVQGGSDDPNNSED